MWKTPDFSKIEERLKGLENALEAVKRDQKAVALEWENTLDKLTRIMGRLNARAKAAAGLQDSEGEPEPASPRGFDLFEAQRELARRKREGNNGVLRGPG